MMDWDISFEDSPWETWLKGKKPGERLSAARLLDFLEAESEEGVEDAFRALERAGVVLDITSLPGQQFLGQAALRLRHEKQLAEDGLDVSSLERNDPLRLYLEEIAGMAPLEEESSLAAKALRGDEAAREQLAAQGLNQVVEIAREYAGYGVLLMDLIQEGSLGLWQAIQSYTQGDYGLLRDAAIRFAMGRAVTLQARNNGVGQKMRQAVEDYRAVDQRLLTELGRNPTLEEIAQQLHMSPEDAAVVQRNLEDARVLHQATQPKQEQEPEEEEKAVEDTAYFQMRQRILDLLSVLSPEDAKLLTLRFGLEGGLPLSPEDTGKQLGLTPGEVVQREAAALAMLRQEG